MKYHKTIYGAAVNLVGVWGPKKMIWNDACGQFYDNSGNFSIDKLGLSEKDCITEFSSLDKKEVQLWVSGVKAGFKRINLFTK